MDTRPKHNWLKPAAARIWRRDRQASQLAAVQLCSRDKGTFEELSRGTNGLPKIVSTIILETCVPSQDLTQHQGTRIDFETGLNCRDFSTVNVANHQQRALTHPCQGSLGYLTVRSLRDRLYC